MSAREQSTRFSFKVSSELPDVIGQLEQITSIIEQQSKVASASADAVKAVLVKQNSDYRATAEESLTIAKEIARQTTIEKKAELDRQTAQLKASEAQNSAYYKAEQQERAAIAKQLAQQSTNEQNSELRKREIQLSASEERQTAITRASLLEQAQINQREQEEITLRTKHEYNERTIAAKAEADQQTAAFRAEQQRQTMILRNELAEQRAEIKHQGAAFAELRGMIASAFGLYEIVQFGKSVADAKSEVDKFRQGLQQMIGSKRETDELFAKLMDMAKTTPFDVENLMQATFQLKAMGTATNDLLPTLNALGNMAAVVGGDKLGLIAKAFNDVQNKGKLMKQELNQFAENGVPLYDLLAESMKKPREEVVKLADAHEISFAQVKKAIFDASEQGGRYYNLMQIQAQTLGGQIANLGDKFFLAKAKLGDYFENGLQRIVGGLADLVDGLAGSDKAIDRNVKLVGAAATAWLTYHGVANASMIAERALAAAITVKNSVLAAGSLAYGTFNLIMITAVGTTDLFTAAQIKSAAAARATWAVLVSNPLGAILLTVGALTTAYLAWQAANVTVAESIGEQQLQLEKEQRSIKSAVEQTMLLAQGKKEHTAAVQALINKYPEYFAGLDAEKTTNAQLKQILDKVNDSYTTRIALAKEAYRTELNENKLKSLVEQQEQLMKIASQRLPSEVMLKVGGDASQLLKVINEVPKYAEMLKGDWMTQIGDDASRLFGGINPTVALKQITAGLQEYEKELKASDARVAQIKTDNNAALIKIEDERHSKVMSQLKAANKSTQAEEKLHTDNLEKIAGTYQEKTIKTTEDHAKKLKSVTLVSEKEIALIKGESRAAEQVDLMKQLEEQLDYLNKQEDAEIAAVKKRKVNKKISDAELKGLQEQARQEIAKIDEKYDKEREKILEQIEAEKQRIFLEGTKDTNQKIEVLTAQRLEAERMLNKLNNARTNEDREAALKEYNFRYEVSLKEQATNQLKIQLDASKKALDDVIAKNGEKGDEYRKAYSQWLKDNEQYNSALTTQTITAAKETAQQIKQYEKEIQQAKRETAQTEKETLDIQNKSRREALNIMLDLLGKQNEFLGQASQAIKAVMGHIDGLNLKAIQSTQAAVVDAQNSLEGIRMIYSDGTAEGMAEIAKAEQRVADATKGAATAKANTLGAALGIFSVVAQLAMAADAAIQESQRKTAEAIATALGRTREIYKELYDYVTEASRDAYQRELENFKGPLEERLRLINDYYAREKKNAEGYDRIEATMAYHQRLAEIMAQSSRSAQDFINLENMRNEQAERLKIQAAEREKQRAKDILDAKLAFIEQELAAKREAAEKEIAGEEEKAARLKGLIEQASSDKQLRLQADSVFREQLLVAGEAREIKALEDARDRELRAAIDSQATAEELSRIKNAFEELITLKHKEYADARGNKEKEVSLATKEIKEKEAADKQTLEQVTGDAIQEIMDKLAKQEAAAATDRLNANTEYANQVMQINRQIFEANKRMKIAELQAQIAILQSQKGLFKNNSAINAAIDAVNAAIGEITALTFDTGSATSSTISSRFGKTTILKEVLEGLGSKEPGNLEDLLKGTGKKFYTGTEFVNGLGLPDGIDTVPAWLTKGERVMTRDQNKMLSGVSNDELVAQSQFVQRLGLGLDDMQAFFEGFGPSMSLPANLLSADSRNAFDIRELTDETRKTRQAIEQQKLLRISIDRQGFAESELGQQSTVNYWGNILKR